jgi:hypothetical protein
MNHIDIDTIASRNWVPWIVDTRMVYEFEKYSGTSTRLVYQKGDTRPTLVITYLLWASITKHSTITSITNGSDQLPLLPHPHWLQLPTVGVDKYVTDDLLKILQTIIQKYASWVSVTFLQWQETEIMISTSTQEG